VRIDLKLCKIRPVRVPNTCTRRPDPEGPLAATSGTPSPLASPIPLDAGAQFIARPTIGAPEQPAATHRVQHKSAPRDRRELGAEVTMSVMPSPSTSPKLRADPAELIAGRLAAPLANDLDRLHEGLLEVRPAWATRHGNANPCAAQPDAGPRKSRSYRSDGSPALGSRIRRPWRESCFAAYAAPN